ncbi:conserved hypothetical protein [Burkholderia pseudomallei 668]|nr:conserved hypothetical protein [Burkholderia pseudomallei 668]
MLTHLQRERGGHAELPFWMDGGARTSATSIPIWRRTVRTGLSS